MFEAISRPASRAEQLAAALGGPAEPLLEAARLMVKMRRSRAAHLDRLREAVGERPSSAGAEFFYVPFMFLRSYGLRSTHQVASALAAELNI